jgi:hypothetical protein
LNEGLAGLFGEIPNIKRVKKVARISKGMTESGRERYGIEFIDSYGARHTAFIYWPNEELKDYFGRPKEEIQKGLDAGDTVYFEDISKFQIGIHLNRQGKESKGIESVFEGTLKSP